MLVVGFWWAWELKTEHGQSLTPINFNFFFLHIAWPLFKHTVDIAFMLNHDMQARYLTLIYPMNHFNVNFHIKYNGLKLMSWNWIPLALWVILRQSKQSCKHINRLSNKYSTDSLSALYTEKKFPRIAQLFDWI